MRTFRGVFAFAAVIAQSGCAVSPRGTSDAEVRNAVRYYETHRLAMAKPDPLVAEALKGVRIEAMSVRQFEMLGLMRDTAPDDLIAKFRARLTELGSAPDEDGAVALALRAGTFEMVDPSAGPAEADAAINARIDAIIEAARHPSFPASVRAGRSCGTYWYAYFYSQNPRLLDSGVIKVMASLVEDDWPLGRLDDLLAFAEAYARPDSGLTRPEIDRLRSRVTTVVHRMEQSPGCDEDTRKRLGEALAVINSAWSREELLDRQAPPFHVLWSAGPGAPLESLSQLKGRVVLLDFWATWCGPCVAAFPHMREVQERYRDRKLSIVGVTSLQGWMLRPWDRDPSKRRTGKLTAEEELKAMPEWVREMGMTWTVVVTKESCFNPDYGVRGIPSLALVDGNGVVRWAGLDAFDPSIEVKLEQLLSELEARPLK